MAEDKSPAMSDERIRTAARETVREGTDIRARVHDITLLALKSRRFDRHGIREVVRAVTEGAASGAESTRADVRQALADALGGLDQALRTSAQAGQAALKQLATTGRDFSDSELKAALANLRRLEEDFLSTVTHVADRASEQVQPQLREVLSTSRRTGTETGRQVASVMAEFAQRFSVASIDAAITGLEVASEFGGRFAALASGVLSGLADALATPRPEERPAGDTQGARPDGAGSQAQPTTKPDRPKAR